MVRMRKLFLAGVVAALAAMTLTSCDVNETAYTGNASGKKVAIIGDQVTSTAANSLHSALDGDYQVRIIAQDNKTLADMQAAADTLAATAPDAIVVNLGTQDVLNNIPSGTTLSGLLTLLGKFPSSCIVLTTINSHATVTGFDASKAVAFNTAISAARQVPWDAVVEGDRDGETQAPDHILPSPTGTGNLGYLTWNTVNNCFGGGGGG